MMLAGQKMETAERFLRGVPCSGHTFILVEENSNSLAGPTNKHSFSFCLSPPLQRLSVLAKYFILGGEVSVSTCGRPVLPVWLVTLIQHKDPLWKHKDKQWRGHNYLIVLTFFFLLDCPDWKVREGKKIINNYINWKYKRCLAFYIF